MYHKSFSIIILAVLIIGLLSTGTRFIFGAISGSALKLPSYYNPGISLTEAIKRSKKPLLIEFYTDQCGTCQDVTPWIHQLSIKHKDDVTFVMIDVDDNKNYQTANLFGIEYVPTLFVFDHVRNKKREVSPKSYSSFKNLSREIESTIKSVTSK